MKIKILKYMATQIAIVLIALLSFIGLVNYARAGTSSANTQANATVSATCTISVQNLSFGNLVLPLSAQTASTSMNVLCSKNHAYTIGLAYGGIYGQGTVGGGGYYLPTGACGTYCEMWNQYSASGSYVGWTQTVMGQEPSDVTSVSKGLYYIGITPYTYGKMLGVASGDNVAYSIQVPGNPGKVWNAGENNYSATGIGATQTIPVVGTLVPSQSGSSYPTPDSYMDTVTATVSF